VRSCPRPKLPRHSHLMWPMLLEFHIETSSVWCASAAFNSWQGIYETGCGDFSYLSPV
jgi:hypothetical protein